MKIKFNKSFELCLQYVEFPPQNHNELFNFYFQISELIDNATFEKSEEFQKVCDFFLSIPYIQYLREIKWENIDKYLNDELYTKIWETSELVVFSVMEYNSNELTKKNKDAFARAMITRDFNDEMFLLK